MGADVVIETFRPGVVERFGLGADELRAENPSLVYASVTAFGRTGPLAGLKGYEGLVMARLGGHDSMGVIIDRPGPAFAAAPYCAFSVAQTALHGILAALFERERSGAGQRVDTTLIQGFAAHDTWNALIGHIARQYPDAFMSASLIDPGSSVPNNSLFFRLIAALSADGRWLQFSQTTPRLFTAFMRVLELDWMFDDPKWSSVPDFDDLEQRGEYFELMLAAIRSKTAAEWNEVFDREPDVWAEIFRDHSELLHHPQMEHDHSVVAVDDAARGSVLQPGPMVKLAATPGSVERSAPALDEHGAALRGGVRTAPRTASTFRQIEGLADLINAETRCQREQALLQAGGFASARYDVWRQSLLRAQGLVEAELDFADEGDVGVATAREARGIVDGLLSEIVEPLKGRGERLRDGVRIVIAGAPNAGKSSLMNALAKRDVAIVSEEAGTTRDVIEVHLDLGGVPVILTDTAGLREAAGQVEAEGVRRALARAEAADVVVWLVDATAPVWEPPAALKAKSASSR